MYYLWESLENSKRLGLHKVQQFEDQHGRAETSVKLPGITERMRYIILEDWTE